MNNFQTDINNIDPNTDEALWLDFYAGFQKITNLDLRHYHQSALKIRLSGYLHGVTSETLPELLKELSGNKHQLAGVFSNILVHESTFFRDPATWELLGSLLAKTQNESIRLLSAGCSQGQEAYTLAIVATDSLPSSKVEVDGIDIGQGVIFEAKRGQYFREDLRLVPLSVRNRYFTTSKDTMDNSIYTVIPEIRSRVSFSVGNVFLDKIKGPYKVITCRNIGLHLNEEGSQILFERLIDNLSPEGFLIVGGTDTLRDLDRLNLREIGFDIYQKIDI